MNIRALQLGGSDYSKQYELVSGTEWNYEPELDLLSKEYDIAFINRDLSDEEILILMRIVRAHCLFVLEGVNMTPSMEKLMRSRCGSFLKANEIENFLKVQLQNYFTVPYGEKFEPHTLVPSPEFKGNVTWNGYTEVVLNGNFGSTMHEAAYWRGNIPVEQNQAIDFWLEYEKDDSVEIELHMIQFVSGSVAMIQNEWSFTEEELKSTVTIDNRQKAGPIFVMLNAKGEGTLKIIALHDRYSRRGVGDFLPGSDRFVTKSGEEIFSYLDPGNLKPPLCVYFSGYKTLEGFEGYHMMRKMGCPFLLISDPRLEGGAFYLGSEEYENNIKIILEEATKKLGFTKNQVILSGLSMGTFGAVYYGSLIQPGFIIIGKPLLNLGDMAQAERIDRPGVFPTSLDLQWKEYHSLTRETSHVLNNRLWEKFDNSDWSKTTFYVAYMLEDDYDSNAYQNLLSHVRGSGAKVIGKGIHGRHNDDTSAIVNWFLRQYNRVLENDFGRKNDSI